MVTKAQLQLANKKQKLKEKNEKVKSQREDRAFIKSMNRSDLKRAETVLDGELGEALTRWNTSGLKCVEIDGCRNWKIGTTWPRDELYGEKFILGFTPNPKSAATKLLLKKLKLAGFNAKVKKEEEGNCESYVTADGQGIQSVPGTHSVYYLVIDWS